MNDSIKREQSELDYSAERENLRPKGKKIINPWRNHEAAKHASMMALDDGILINGVVFASLNNANIYYVRACLAF